MHKAIHTSMYNNHTVVNTVCETIFYFIILTYSQYKIIIHNVLLADMVSSP